MSKMIDPQIEVRLKALGDRLAVEVERAKTGRDIEVPLTEPRVAVSLTQVEAILAEIAAVLKLFHPPAKLVGLELKNVKDAEGWEWS